MMTSAGGMSMSPPPGTVSCMLCRGVVAYRGGDSTRFNNHMNYEHGAYFDIEFLLAACLMNNEERDAVKNVMSMKLSALEEVTEPPRHTPQKPEPRRELSQTSKLSSQKEVPNTFKTPPPTKRKHHELESEEDKSASRTEVKQETQQDEQQSKKIQFECGDCAKVYQTRKAFLCHQNRQGHGSKRPKSATPSLPFPTPPRSVTPPPSSPLITSSESSDFENLTQSWLKATESLTSKDSIKDYSFKKEDTLDKDFFEKVSTLDELPEESSTTESSDWRSIISSASPDDAINTLLGLGIEGSTDEDVDDPPAPETTTAEETKKHMPNNEESNDEDVDDPPASEATKLEETKKDMQPELIIKQVDCSKSKYFKANPHTLGKVTDKGLSFEQFTVVDDNLPDGWKVKETTKVCKNGRKDIKRVFLTADQKVLKTGLAVLEFMRLTGSFSAKEIMDIAKHLAVPVNRLEKYMELYL